MYRHRFTHFTDALIPVYNRLFENIFVVTHVKGNIQGVGHSPGIGDGIGCAAAVCRAALFGPQAQHQTDYFVSLFYQ